MKMETDKIIDESNTNSSTTQVCLCLILFFVLFFFFIVFFLVQTFNALRPFNRFGCYVKWFFFNGTVNYHQFQIYFTICIHFSFPSKYLIFFLSLYRSGNILTLPISTQHSTINRSLLQIHVHFIWFCHLHAISCSIFHEQKKKKLWWNVGGDTTVTQKQHTHIDLWTTVFWCGSRELAAHLVVVVFVVARWWCCFIYLLIVYLWSVRGTNPDTHTHTRTHTRSSSSSSVSRWCVDKNWNCSIEQCALRVVHCQPYIPFFYELISFCFCLFISS